MKAGCVEAAHKACEASDDCMAFAIATTGGDPNTAARAQLFRAGVGNTVEGGGWQLYAKAKPCSTCPDGGGSVPSKHVPKSPKAWQHRQCSPGTPTVRAHRRQVAERVHAGDAEGGDLLRAVQLGLRVHCCCRHPGCGLR